MTDSSGSHASASATITVATRVFPPLSVIISASLTQGTAPLTVSFSSSVTGGSGSYTYEWNFGDGGTDTSANPIHMYSTSGEYNVVLRVTNSIGASVSTGFLSIDVKTKARDLTFVYLGAAALIAAVAVTPRLLRTRSKNKPTQHIVIDTLPKSAQMGSRPSLGNFSIEVRSGIERMEKQALGRREEMIDTLTKSAQIGKRPSFGAFSVEVRSGIRHVEDQS